MVPPDFLRDHMHQSRLPPLIYQEIPGTGFIFFLLTRPAWSMESNFNLRVEMLLRFLKSLPR